MRDSGKNRYRGLVYLATILLALSATVFVLIQACGYFVAHHHARLQAYLSQRLHQEVTLERAELRWHTLRPVIHLSNVVIKNIAGAPVEVSAEQLSLSISLFESIKQRQFIPRNVGLSGVKLSVRDESLPTKQKGFSFTGLHGRVHFDAGEGRLYFTGEKLKMVPFSAHEPVFPESHISWETS